MPRRIPEGCTSRCWYAKGPKCDCACMGKFHGAAREPDPANVSLEDQERFMKRFHELVGKHVDQTVIRFMQDGKLPPLDVQNARRRGSKRPQQRSKRRS